MTLEEFAETAGVKVTRCNPEWGGTYAYKTVDHPDITIAGFRSKKAALNGWLRDIFGKQAAKALTSLLKKESP